MFHEYISSGKHMICDFKGIQNTELLNNCKELNLLLKDICRENDFQILDEINHGFEPIGCSIVFLLSESHISIHTFPEKAHMSLDIYTCRQYKDNQVYNSIFNYLKTMLDAANNSTCNIIDRFF